jgi:hypothetical protein
VQRYYFLIYNTNAFLNYFETRLCIEYVTKY